MKTIGLTGGMGSGKTYIASIFRQMNIPIYDSDENAKRLMAEDSVVRSQIIGLLGSDAYDHENKLNRAFVAGKIFTDSEKLVSINKIVHPAVRNDFQKYVNNHQNAPYVINEAALFVENGTYKDFDFLITVVSPMKMRLRRLKARDKKTEKEILQRITKQSSDKEKILKSNFIIYNDGINDLFQQISNIHQAILA